MKREANVSGNVSFFVYNTGGDFKIRFNDLPHQLFLISGAVFFAELEWGFASQVPAVAAFAFVGTKINFIPIAGAAVFQVSHFLVRLGIRITVFV